MPAGKYSLMGRIVIAGGNGRISATISKKKASDGKGSNDALLTLMQGLLHNRPIQLHEFRLMLE